MKKCKTCKINKSKTDFPKHGGSKCKTCYNKYKREKGYNSYSRRSSYLSEYQRRLRATDEGKQYDIKYRTTYKESFAGVVTDLLCSARKRAKDNGLEIGIDRDWVIRKLMPMKCEATGIILTLQKDKTVAHTPFKPSIDRIDNNKGYTKENCRIVAVIYNKAKSDYTDEDVLKMATSLVKQNV